MFWIRDIQPAKSMQIFPNLKNSAGPNYFGQRILSFYMKNNDLDILMDSIRSFQTLKTASNELLVDTWRGVKFMPRLKPTDDGPKREGHTT